MAEYLSGGIYFSGIGNGTDFSSIVDQLKKVEEIPKNRLESWKSDWKIRYDAFSQVIDSMREAQTKLAAINNPSKFVVKKATSSKESVLTAKADAKALDSNHTIEVLQKANNGIWAFNGSYANKNTSVNTSGTDQTFSYTYKGKTRDVNIPPGTTLESMVNLVNKDGKNPGVQMNLIQTGGAVSFQIMGKDTGKEAELTVHPNNLDGMNSAKNTWSSPITDPSLPFTGLSDIEYSVTNSHTGITEIFKVPSIGNLNNLVDQINNKMGSGTATITTTDGKSTLTLADGVSASGRGLDGKVTTTNRFVTDIVDGMQTIDPLNPDPTADVVYTMNDKDGVSHSYKVKAGGTINDLVTVINKDFADRGLSERVSLSNASGTWKFEQPEGYSALKGPGFNDTTTKSEVVSSTWTSDVDPTRQLDTVTYTVEDAAGTTHTFDMLGNQNFNDLRDAINGRLGPPDIAKITTDASGKSSLSLVNIRSIKGEGLDGKITSSDTWSIQHAENAIFKVDNWPREMESASNTVKDVIEGVEFNILDTGITQLSVKADTESVKKNVQGYLDAVNGVIKTMQDLSKVEEIESGEEEKYDKNSQFAKVKGGVLTGNYGTQLLNSRMKSLASGVPSGFTRVTGEDVLSGDMVAALAQMGIKTCTQEGDPNYGLFSIAPPSTNAEMQAMDQEMFDKALEKNLDDVINLFAADNIAKTDSADFHYSSHIQGMSKPGNYDVSYAVNPDGTMGDVFINGVKAQANGNGKYTAGSDAGDAKSLSIQIDNLTPGTHTGKISIQQGKVGEMETFLAAELRYNKADPKNNGSIMVLKENYKGIMDNIDKKIEKEEERIIKWERRQRLEYSRLETLLGNYERQMSSMQSQLGGLNSGS